MGCALSFPKEPKGLYYKNKEIKIILLGAGESGKSTIMKQIKMMYALGYSLDESLSMIPVIHSNILQSVLTILSGMQQLGIYFVNPSKLVDARELFKYAGHYIEGNLDQKIFDLVLSIIDDPGFIKCLSQGHLYCLNDSAYYFLSNLERISTTNYFPTEADILHARLKTVGVNELNFEYRKINFRLLDVGGQASERHNWVRCFDGASVVIFVVALTDYDQYMDSQMNRLKESLSLFHSIRINPWFRGRDIILFFNKCDLFAMKIKTVPLQICFPEYTGQDTYDEASAYILSKFLDSQYANHTVSMDSSSQYSQIQLHSQPKKQLNCEQFPKMLSTRKICHEIQPNVALSNENDQLDDPLNLFPSLHDESTMLADIELELMKHKNSNYMTDSTSNAKQDANEFISKMNKYEDSLGDVHKSTSSKMNKIESLFEYSKDRTSNRRSSLISLPRTIINSISKSARRQSCMFETTETSFVNDCSRRQSLILSYNNAEQLKKRNKELRRHSSKFEKSSSNNKCLYPSRFGKIAEEGVKLAGLPKIYPHFTCATDRKKMEIVFCVVTETIIDSYLRNIITY